MIPQIPSPFTHPDTARFVVAVPLLLTIVAILVAVLLGRGTLLPLRQQLLVRYSSRNRVQVVDPALIYVPQIMNEQQFLLLSFVVVPVLWLLTWSTMPMFLSLLLTPVILIAVIALALKVAERRYVQHLNQALAPTAARMAALLANGSGFQIVLRQLVNDLPTGPLRDEWSFIVERLGVPMVSGGVATSQTVVNALRFQTPSLRHRILLEHLAVALGQTHDIVAKRMQAASQALYDSDRRASAAATELAQMKYSGIAVGGAGLFLAVYLALTQSERFLAAYQGPIGLFAGIIVGGALLMPIIGGLFLARIDEIDY